MQLNPKFDLLTHLYHTEKWKIDSYHQFLKRFFYYKESLLILKNKLLGKNMKREIACLLNFHNRKVNTEFAKSITFLSRLNLLKLKKLTMKNQKILYSGQKTVKWSKTRSLLGKTEDLAGMPWTHMISMTDYGFKMIKKVHLLNIRKFCLLLYLTSRLCPLAPCDLIKIIIVEISVFFVILLVSIDTKSKSK